MASISTLNLDANLNRDSSAVQEALAAGASVPDASTYEDLIAIEKARERKGAESTLKKCFDFSQSSQVIENVLTFLETQTKSQSRGTNNVSSPKKATESTQKDTTVAPGTSWPAPAVPSPPIPVPESSTTDFWEPKSRAQQDDVTLKVNAILDNLAEYSRKSNVSTPTPVGASTPTSREADSVSSPSRETVTGAASTDIASACSGRPNTSKKTSKLDSIKQMVMQKRR